METDHPRTTQTLCRIVGTVVGILVTWLALAFASDNCEILFMGLMSMIFVLPVGAFAVCQLPRTREVDQVLTVLLVALPLLGFLLGHLVPSLACDL